MYSKGIKRILDFIIGLIALPFIVLITLIIAPIIYFNDKGPIFYNALRLGRNGKPFKMYKFRSMMVNAPDIRNKDGSTYNGDDDPRVTKVGRFMRKTSIDELPQFLNVLLGDMSLIGPRPDPLDDMEIYTEHQKKKLNVRPGITGYNQAYYRIENIGMIWNALDHFWVQNYNLAKEYYEEHGNLDVPMDYKTKDGTLLGSWIGRQRKLRKGIAKGTPLTEEQINKLDLIGMDWMDRVDRIWENGFIEAKKYYETYGHLNVPVKYKSPSDFPLGNWIQRQRNVYKKNKISPERIERLIGIGMNWNPNSWEHRFELVKQYYEEYGHIIISQKEVIQGVWLGKWIVSQKKAMEEGKLTHKQIEMLKTLPMEEVGRKDNHWWSMYEEAKKYYLKFGNLNIPMDYLTSSGKKLSDWIIRQRRNYKLGKMTSEHKEKLDEIGFIWDLGNTWTNSTHTSASITY